MTDDAKQGNIIPFGKYKGRLIEELLVDDPAYLHWLANQDWFRAKFMILHQVIINRGAEPEETPDHNALQVKFLDDEFCLKFLRHLEPDCMHAPPSEFLFERGFEVQGIDVLLIVRSMSRYTNWNGSAIEPWKGARRFDIELKPIVGDDYPAVLRQMKRTGAKVLVVGEYTGTGATREQFVKTMTIEGVRVVFAGEMAMLTKQGEGS